MSIVPIRNLGGKIEPRVLTIFDNVSGLNPRYSLSGNISVSGSSLYVTKGGTGYINPAIDVTNYSKMQIRLKGGYADSVSYPFNVYNGSTLLTYQNASSFVDREVNISNINSISLKFVGNSVSDNNEIAYIRFVK